MHLHGREPSNWKAKLSSISEITLFLSSRVFFQNDLEAFDDARKNNIDKYSELARELSINKKNAVVLGALGSWDPAK